MLAIKNAVLVMPGHYIPDATLLAEDGKIVDFGKNILTLSMTLPRIQVLISHLLLKDGQVTWHLLNLFLNLSVARHLPSSMLQTKKTQVYISEELAAPFECWEKIGY